MRANRLLMASPLALAGCVNGAINAPADAILSVPDDMAVPWTSEWNEVQDGLGAVSWADIGVYDQRQELPLESIYTEVVSNYGGVCLIPAEAVLTVSQPETPKDWDTNYQEYCYDENGNFDPSENEWCAWYSDTINDRYYELGGDYADAGGYCPNYVEGVTDSRGIFRVFMYIDKLPVEGDAFGEVVITASIQVYSASFAINTGD